MPIKLMEHF